MTNTSPADRGRNLLEKCVLFSSLDEKARRDIAAYARPRSFATGLKNAIHVGHSTGGGEVVHCIARHGESRGTKGFQAIPEPFPKIKRSERQGQSEPAGKKPIARHRVTCEAIGRAREIFAALYHIRIFELGTTRARGLYALPVANALRSIGSRRSATPVAA